MKLDSTVESSIESVISKLGYEYYEIKYFNAGGKTILRVFADTDIGITMDECVKVSRAISEVLDEMDFGKSEYTLEVSSPGLDRPLKDERDFKRFIAKDVQVRFRNEKGNARKFSGQVKSVTDSSVTLTNDEEEREFNYDSILSGKVII